MNEEELADRAASADPGQLAAVGDAMAAVVASAIWQEGGS